MSRFAVRPALRIRGRQFRGIRGFEGKPSHPPLTDVPIAAYILAMLFDVISAIAGDDSSIGRDFFVSATHVIVAGAVVSLATAVTGFWDWLRGTTPGTEVRRTANWHMLVMLVVTGIVLVDIVVRLLQWDEGATGPVVLVLSILAGGLVAFGAIYGGSLVYDHGFNVQAADGPDSPGKP